MTRASATGGIELVSLITHTNRYRACSDGETVMCVPVPDAAFAALRKRAENILQDSRALVTDKAMPPETYIHTPGPFYRAAGPLLGMGRPAAVGAVAPAAR